MNVTEFKAKCLGVIERVRKEKSRVTLTRHGRPAAEIVPVQSSAAGALFGRSKGKTVISGNLLHTGESWNAED